MRREIVKELVDYFLSPDYDRNPAAFGNYCLGLLETALIETEQPFGDWREKLICSEHLLTALAELLCRNEYSSLLNLAYRANRDAKATGVKTTKNRQYKFKHLFLNLLILVFEEQYRIILNPADGDDPLVKMFKPALAIKRDGNTLGLYFYTDLWVISNRKKIHEVWFSPERKPLKYHLPVSEVSAAVRPIVISLLNDEPDTWRLCAAARNAHAISVVP